MGFFDLEKESLHVLEKIKKEVKETWLFRTRKRSQKPPVLSTSKKNKKPWVHYEVSEATIEEN